MIFRGTVLSVCFLWLCAEAAGFTRGRTQWQKLPSEEGGMNYFKGEEDSGPQEYYELTHEATTDEPGWRCHERLFARRNKQERLPVSCLYDCEHSSGMMIQKKYSDKGQCINMTMENYIRFHSHVPCLIGVCERGYCRNATTQAYCNPTRQNNWEY